jgi:Zn-dependent protease
MNDLLYNASVWILPALVAITFHEAAHGFVAWRLGDDTAKRAGRVTFNPLKHIDPLGTVILPGLLVLTKAPFLFGWAKPVPVNFMRLNQPRRDMVLVAAAGPGINLLLAFAAAMSFHLLAAAPAETREWLSDNLANAFTLNLVLAVFNMIPLPPLDGGRVAVGLLPDALAYPLARLERVGMLLLIGVLFLLPFVASRLGFDFNPFNWVLLPVVEALASLVGGLAGLF